MNRFEKIGTGAATTVGAATVGAAAGYTVFGVKHNASIESAQNDIDCAEALADMSGTFEELPSQCANRDLLTVQERDRSREEFYTISENGNISQEVSTQELIIFDSVDTIVETAAMRLDHAEAEKHDDQIMGLYGGAVFGFLALSAYVGYRLSRRPVGKHGKPKRQSGAMSPVTESSTSTESGSNSASVRTKVPVDYR